MWDHVKWQGASVDGVFANLAADLEIFGILRGELSISSLAFGRSAFL